MSSGFDFFGAPNTPGAPGAPSAPSAFGAPGATPVGAPTVDRWGLPSAGGYPVSSVDLSSPFATSADATSGRRSRLWYAVIAVVVIAVTAVGFYVLRLPHPVALPSSLAGMPKMAIPAGQGHDLDLAKKSLSHEGLHDVSVGIYGASDASEPGLVVIAARASSNAPDFNQLVGAMGAAGIAAVLAVGIGLFILTPGSLGRVIPESSFAWGSIQHASAAVRSFIALKSRSVPSSLNVQAAELPGDESESSFSVSRELQIHTVVVQPGETLHQIILETGGENSAGAIEQIEKLNPSIADFGHLQAGQTIQLPQASSAVDSGASGEMPSASGKN